MSLLMDALKKAEQEKKEAARRLKEAQERTGEQIKLQTDDHQDTAETSGQKDGPSKEESRQAGSSIVTEKKSSPGLSLSQLDENTVEHKPGPELSTTHQGAKKTEPESLFLEDVTIEHAGLSGSFDENDLNDEKQPTPGDDKSFALTDLNIEEDSIPPFDDTGDDLLREKFTDTLSGSRSFKSVISAAELAKDIGSLGKTAPTPVAAQTVFSAIGGVSGQRKVMEWVVFLGLFAVIMAAAGTFYYLKITPLTPEVSSPLVAQGVEVDALPAFVVPLPAEETPVSASAALPAAATVATIESPAAPVAGPEQPEVAAGEPEPMAISGPEAADWKPPVIETTATQSMPEENNILPEKIQVDEQAIAISRTKSADKKDQLINAAYAQYNAGNFIQAEAAYQEVLKTMPENRDALLGNAAIAWRKGNVRGAYEYYLKVLKLYPRDVVAITGMISLQDNTDPLKNESTIKLMLREQPDTAFLHFALGNNYAAQSRWPEAQQAFFEAHRLQPDNPDYAYNLAVSLDHIGQSRAAIEYYNKALELTDSTQVSFNTANVLARVNDLTQVSNQ